METLQFRIEICPFASRPGEIEFPSDGWKVFVVEVPQTQIAAEIDGEENREFVAEAMAKAFASAFYDDLYHCHGVYGTKLVCTRIDFCQRIRKASKLVEMRDEYILWELSEDEGQVGAGREAVLSGR